MAHSLNEFLAAATADTIRCTNQFEIELNTGDEELNKIIEDNKIILFGQNLAIPSRGIQYADVRVISRLFMNIGRKYLQQFINQTNFGATNV